jgi:hypothetical protein
MVSRMRLEMTVASSCFSISGLQLHWSLLFFCCKAFAQPALPERDKLFCERWAALGLGILTIIACSVGMQFVQGEGVIVRSAKLLGSTVVWLLV